MRRSRVHTAALLATVAVTGCGGDVTAAVTATPTPRSRDSAAAGPTPIVSPAVGGRHDRFTVAITSRHATGVFGRTRRGYTVEAHASRPTSGCVNNRDRAFPDRPAGTRIQAELDPARGDGGPEGWCRGLFRGTVSYSEGFACPPAGRCHPPPGYPKRNRLVGRFSFRVQ